MSYSYRDAFYWDGNLGTNVLIMNKKTGQSLPIKVRVSISYLYKLLDQFRCLLHVPPC